MSSAPDWLPKDWKRIYLKDGTVVVDRAGEIISLEEALLLRDLLVTTSRPHLREPVRA